MEFRSELGLPKSQSAKAEEYTLYAEHCLKMARLAPDQQSRIIQREMAAEWLNLASAVAGD